MGRASRIQNKRASAGEAPRLPMGGPALTATPQEGVTSACSTPPLIYGTAPIVETYQWQKDGVNIGGATAATFPVPGSGYATSLLRRLTTYTNAIGALSNVATAALIVSAAAPAPGPAPAPPPPTYGAAADANQSDDPTTQAVAYDAGTLFTEGQWVLDSGSYYYCRRDCLGVALSNATYWWNCPQFIYVDADSGNDATGGPNANPATAKANPIQTLVRLADYFDTNGATYQATAKCFGFLKRNTTAKYRGSITFMRQHGLGCYGSGTLPEILFENTTSRTFTGNTVEAQNAGSESTIRNLKINPQRSVHFAYTGSTTLVAGDVVTRVSDGLKQATVVHDPFSNRITLRFTNDNDAGSGANTLQANDVIQTAGGAKTCTISASPNATRIAGCATNGTAVLNFRVNNIYVSNAVSNGVGSGSTGTRGSADGFYINNSFITDTCKWGGNGAGIQGGWGAGIKLLHISSWNNGQNVTGAHQAYLDDLDTSEVAYCYFYMTGTYGNHGLVVHGNCTGNDIHDNDINGCQNGIGINDGYFGSWAETFNGFNVFRNIIRNCGNAFGGSGLIFDLSCMVNCKVFNNLAYNNKYVVSISDFSHTGAPNTPTNTLLFAFNTIVSDATTNGDYLVKVNGASTTAVSIRCNVLISSNVNVATVQVLAALVSQVTLDYNLIYNTSGRTLVILWGATSYTTATFSGATNGNATNKTGAPLFTNQGANDYTLQAGSPAKAAGVAISGITTDFAQTTRSGTVPSMGCFE
jgi:hypothetical protein